MPCLIRAGRRWGTFAKSWKDKKQSKKFERSRPVARAELKGNPDAKSKTAALEGSYIETPRSRLPRTQLRFRVSQLSRAQAPSSRLPQVRLLQRAGSNGNQGIKVSADIRGNCHSCRCNGFGQGSET